MSCMCRLFYSKNRKKRDKNDEKGRRNYEIESVLGFILAHFYGIIDILKILEI